MIRVLSDREVTSMVETDLECIENDDLVSLLLYYSHILLYCKYDPTVEHSVYPIIDYILHILIDNRNILL